MTTRQEDEIGMMEYYQVIKSRESNTCITIDEAALEFVSLGYAEKYASIWYQDIPMQKLKDKMFNEFKRENLEGKVFSLGDMSCTSYKHGGSTY